MKKGQYFTSDHIPCSDQFSYRLVSSSQKWIDFLLYPIHRTSKPHFGNSGQSFFGTILNGDWILKIKFSQVTLADTVSLFIRAA